MRGCLNDYAESTYMSTVNYLQNEEDTCAIRTLRIQRPTYMYTTIAHGAIKRETTTEMRIPLLII